MPTPLLEARQVTRRFGTFTALDSVDFALAPGEVHALLGENGAGKSTLMNLLSGLLRPTQGELRRDGTPVRFRSPADAAAQGIGMVHQHFLLVPPLSVVENLLLSAGREHGGALSYPLRAVLDEAKALAQRLGWDLPWDAPAGSLPVGTQQRIEILKALRGETRVLIFDEPTAVLTPTETPELFATIRQLAAEGRGIVFISHKLDEVLALSDRITVLRRGKVVAQLPTTDATTESLARAMVGEGSEAAAMLTQAQQAVRTGGTRDERPARLELTDLTVGERGAARPLLDQVSLTVAVGEIVGIAGVDGNGQTELADCLSGMRRASTGTIQVDGQPLTLTPRGIRQAGVAVIPADRQKRGLLLPLSLTENIALTAADEPAFQRGPLVRWGALRSHTADLIRRFDIRAEGPQARAAGLSGGNQQKVVIARALRTTPKVVVAVNPTRGLDVGAIAYVHEALRRARDEGAAILLISTELDEVLTLSDRVGVLYSGKLVAMTTPETPRETLGRWMGGATV